MASPALTLRFRDTTPGIDTIIEHRAILSQNGLVAWGWWKKTFENARNQEIVQRLKEEGEILINLIDHSTNRQFLCRCAAFIEPCDVDKNLIPQYYRGHALMTAGFFIITSIDDTKFDAILADAIDELTFLWADEQTTPSYCNGEMLKETVGRTCVLHLSDLHFGDDYGFRMQCDDVLLGDSRKTLTDCLVADLERLGLNNKIAVIIVTGDFVTRGNFSDSVKKAALDEFSALRSRLNLDLDQIIAVPGNHDVVRYPQNGMIDLRENAIGMQTRYEHETAFRTFVDELVGRDWKEPLNYSRRIRLGKIDLDICVVNSCTITATEWTEYGYVGHSGLDAIQDLEKNSIDRPTYRFLALHHHLLPVANVEALNSKGVTLTLNASEILSASQKSGVHVALHGHQHKPKIAMYQNLGLNGDATHNPIFVVANGSSSAGNTRLPAGERNTYGLFILTENAIEVRIRELRLDGQQGMETFAQSLSAPPLTK